MITIVPHTMMIVESVPRTHSTGLLDQFGREITSTEIKEPIGFIILRERPDEDDRRNQAAGR